LGVPTYGVDYLTRLLANVDDFAEAFESWMRTQVESDHLSSRGLFPTVWRRDDADAGEVRVRELRVAEAAGAAARAVAVTGAYIGVVGVGPLDPIANWALMAAPKALLTPADIRLTAATTAADHWTSHQYRVAVREAAEALTQEWKAKLGRHDVDDTVFWQQTLSPGEPEALRPKVAWPGEVSDKTVKGMREGLMHLAIGLNLTVRNVTTHTREELSEQEGMERLAAYSYFARLLDECTVRVVPTMTATAH